VNSRSLWLGIVLPDLPYKHTLACSKEGVQKGDVWATVHAVMSSKQCMHGVLSASSTCLRQTACLHGVVV
jgi:hypothetical protein